MILTYRHGLGDKSKITSEVARGGLGRIGRKDPATPDRPRAGRSDWTIRDSSATAAG
jgi:hypothetical protein